jgi:hypothetical protein
VIWLAKRRIGTPNPSRWEMLSKICAYYQSPVWRRRLCCLSSLKCGTQLRLKTWFSSGIRCPRQIFKGGDCKLITWRNYLQYLQLVAYRCKRFPNTRCTVEWGIYNSRAAAQVDLRGLRTKTSSMLSIFSPYTTGRPAPFVCKTLSVSLDDLYPACIDGLGSGVSRCVFLKRLWKRVSEFVSTNHSTHYAFCGFTATGW